MTCCRRAPTSPGCSAPHSLAFLWCCSHSFTALSPLALLLCLKRISNIVEACVHTDSQSRAQQPAASTCMPCASTIALWMRLCSICELYGCQLPTQRCFLFWSGQFLLWPLLFYSACRWHICNSTDAAASLTAATADIRTCVTNCYGLLDGLDTPVRCF